MLWRISADFRCDWVNQAWLEFTGSSLDQQTGFGWLEFLHPEDAERTAEHLDRAFETRTPVEIEFRLRRHDGSYGWFFDRGVPLYRHGCFAGFVGSCVDAHELKLAEAEIHRLRAQLA
jgi:PAS domain S-box-containing protein